MLTIFGIVILCLSGVRVEGVIQRRDIARVEGIRLANGTTERAGRLEVMSRGVWGTVCDDRFTNNAADVVCRSLGFLNATGIAVPSRLYFGHAADETPIMLDNVFCRGQESSLENCRRGPIGRHDCIHAEDIGIVCAQEIEGVRLVDGTTERAGRLEVMAQGVWGSVCASHFDAEEATVVCRSLGFQNTPGFSIRSREGFGHDDSDTFPLLDEVDCSGNESSLNECEHDPIGDTMCVFGQIGVVCVLGGIEGVRLVGGPNAQIGRLEVMSQSIWGSVCADMFDYNAANVVCRSLGFSNISRAAVYYADTFSPGVDVVQVRVKTIFQGYISSPILLDDVICHGNETSLNECQHRTIGRSNCGHALDVGIICGPGIEVVRLANGPNERTGRLEVMSVGRWGTVCNHNFNAREATVVCRSLGFMNTAGYVDRPGRYGSVAYHTPILLHDVTCQGDELSLNECRHRPIGQPGCLFGRDVVIECVLGEIEGVRLVGGQTLRAGRVEVMAQGVWGTVCADSFTNAAATVVCRSLGFQNHLGFTVGSTNFFGRAADEKPILLNDVRCHGNESTLHECEHRPLGDNNCDHDGDIGVVCTLGGVDGIRLVGGPDERRGRLEVMSQGIWGTVCADRFNDIAANVVCRSLGLLNTTGTVATPRGLFGFADLTTPILLDDVRCLGNETSINECEHSAIGYHDCGHEHNVNIICALGGIDGIRLVDGPDERQGRLEVMSQGIWGYVCGDRFNDIAANVVCHLLGLLNTTGTVRTGRHLFGFADLTTPILLDDVRCLGNETSLNECELSAIGYHDCEQEHIVNIECDCSRATISDVTAASTTTTTTTLTTATIPDSAIEPNDASTTTTSLTTTSISYTPIEPDDASTTTITIISDKSRAPIPPHQHHDHHHHHHHYYHRHYH